MVMGEEVGLALLAGALREVLTQEQFIQGHESLLLPDASDLAHLLKDESVTKHGPCY